MQKYMEGRSLVDPSARFTSYDSVDLVGFVIEAVTKPKWVIGNGRISGSCLVHETGGRRAGVENWP